MWCLLILNEMKINQHGEQIFSQDDICDLIMQGRSIDELTGLVVEPTVDIETAAAILENVPKFILYDELVGTMPTQEFDHRNQAVWFMPEQYQRMDIAEHVLGLCNTDTELQRCGEELVLFQERDLFNLLRYLVYLVDVMRENRLIWGAGRGSSVASYVLYKLGVHRIDSLFYELDPTEFLR